MKRSDVSIVIPVLNQLDYTRRCLASLETDQAAGVPIIVVDNGSTDGTAEFLAARPDLEVIRNQENRGCAAAWNQGVRAAHTPWVILLNNDVLVTEGWLAGLLAFAKEHPADIVSPGLREGELAYDLGAYARDFVASMKGVARNDAAHGICFMVRQGVFETIGLFDEMFRIGQFEDADFFLRARRAGFRLGTTGRAFIHHFGSVTQKALRAADVPRPYEVENRAYFRKKWSLGWWRRRRLRVAATLQAAWWRRRERWLGGHTLNEKWINGRMAYH